MASAAPATRPAAPEFAPAPAAAAAVASPERDFNVAAPERDFNVAAHGLRGIAALMVFVAHLFGGTAEHIYAANHGYADAIKPFWNIGTFGVELFFVISGFVIMPSIKRYSLGQFGLRRLLRLYPLFLVFSLLFIILNAATSAYPKLDTPLAVVSGLLFLNLFTGTEQLTPNAWSLSFEVFFYILAALTWYFAVTRRNMVMAVVMLAASVAFLVWLPIVSYFVLGVVIRAVHDRGWFVPRPLAQGLEVGVLAAMLWLASIDHYEYSWADLAKPQVVPLIACTALYFYLAVHPGSLTSRLLANKVTLYLGTVSFSLYIVHPYVYLPMRLAFDRLGWFTPDTWGSMLAFVAVVTPLVLVATAIVYEGLERWPYARFFQQDIYRRKSTTVTEEKP
jgi:peptidoglycan/LPS O-acetylase OafA/YrhL